MRTSLILLLACALGASGMSGAQPTETPQAAAARVIVGYLPSYRLEHFPPRQLDIGGAADRMTHLVYAFGDVTNGLPTFHDEQMAFSRLFTADESVDNQTDIAGPTPALRGALNQLRKLKARHPHLAVLMSLGGSSRDNASGFSLAARTDASRQAFVSACLDLFIRGHLPNGVSARGVFDGLDLDWEFPTDCRGPTGSCVPEDKANFTLLLAEFRRQLDEQGRIDGVRYQLTIAGSAWADDFDKYEFQKIASLLDFIGVMTYGLAPDRTTRPQAALYKSSRDIAGFGPTFNADYAVTRYLQEGVPADKIVMGVPFFAHGWQGVPDVNHGLYQQAAGPALGSIGLGDEQYSRLKDLQGFYTFRDPETAAVWLFNPRTGILWSFDDPGSLVTKMDYIRKRNLRGVMFWDVASDDANGSLLDAIWRSLS